MCERDSLLVPNYRADPVVHKNGLLYVREVLPQQQTGSDLMRIFLIISLSLTHLMIRIVGKLMYVQEVLPHLM